MNINFVKLHIENFKNHSILDVDFADITNIEGRNGAGKSSIAEAITWCLYGVDALGSKLDPKPLDNQEAEIKVELLLEVDGKQILLIRSQKKTAKYYINEVPEKATRFNELVAELFDKDLFLSIFNPTYFSSQNWQIQREQLLSYISEPTNKEILNSMSKNESGYLIDDLKKKSLEDIEKINRDTYNKSDKAYERAAERVLTLKEHLEKMELSEASEDELNKKIEAAESQVEQLTRESEGSRKKKQEKMKLEYELNHLKDKIIRQKEAVNRIKDIPIQENCYACGQDLDEKSITVVKEKLKTDFEEAKKLGMDMVAQFNEVKAKLDPLLGATDATDYEQIRALDEIISSSRHQLHKIIAAQVLEKEMQEADEQKERIRKERNKALGTIDAIKSFKAIRSNLMVKKVSDLFTNISVKLYELQKNGEEKPTFEVEMDGKSFSKLSTAERIKCGLELSEVLSEQSQVVAPTFLDNAESILKFQKPRGQLIVARVVDRDLSITSPKIKGEVENV